MISIIRTLSFRRPVPFVRVLPNDIYFWMKALLLALLAIQVAKLFWAIVTPVGPFGEWRPATPRLLSAEAQASLFASVDPFFQREAMGGAQAAAVQSLDLVLFGVRASSGILPGSAILGPPDGEQKAFQVGEEVAPGVTLKSVAFDHVVLDRGNSEGTLFIEGAEDAQSASTPSSGGTAVAAAAIGGAFDLKPRRQGDRVTGVLVTPGRNQALFESAGFRTGDVIVAVNGARITSMIDVQQLQSSIAPGARLLLSIERGAEVVPIALNLPGKR